MSIAWDKPLEAVHEANGEIVPVEWTGNWSALGNRVVRHTALGGQTYYNDSDGRNAWDGKWRIRNVQPTLSASKVDDALVERMVALVRDMADDDRNGIYYADARAVAALLPKPVDPDLVEMRKIYAQHFEEDPRDRSLVHVEAIVNGDYDDAATGKMILAAIKRGRELATKP